jgi:hypothetical protein
MSAPTTPSATAAPSGQAVQATFHLCSGTADQAERSIEQLIAGRAFSATLTGQQDGCADLLVAVTGPQSGRQNSTMSVGLAGAGAQGPGRNVRVQIVSENGATLASISVDG